MSRKSQILKYIAKRPKISELELCTHGLASAFIEAARFAAGRRPRTADLMRPADGLKVGRKYSASLSRYAVVTAI